MIILNKDNLADFQNWLEIADYEGAAALIDKTENWTSFDVIAKLRGITKIRKIGHAGTLDPFATGLLIICCGKATKLISSFQNMEKTYEAVLKLGATTITQDIESEEENITDITNITNESITQAFSSFTGEITQMPPAYSAKKVNGKPLYKYARQNIAVEVKPVQVIIHTLKIKKIKKPFVSFEVVCSKGTYIRSLAKDIGDKLGCGAYLTELRRTNIGEYSVKDSLTIQEIQNWNVKKIVASE